MGKRHLRSPVDVTRSRATLAGRQQDLAVALNGFYKASVKLGSTLYLDPTVTLVPKSGALVASLMMGVAESLGIQFIGADSGLIVVFLMLLLTLAVRPSGLAGGRAR